MINNSTLPLENNYNYFGATVVEIVKTVAFTGFVAFDVLTIGIAGKILCEDDIISWNVLRRVHQLGLKLLQIIPIALGDNQWAKSLKTDIDTIQDRIKKTGTSNELEILSDCTPIGESALGGIGSVFHCLFAVLGACCSAID